MPRINLLPWREDERKKRQRDFMISLGGAFTSRRHYRDGQEQGNGSMRKLIGLATIVVAFFLVACDADPALVGGADTGGTGGTGGTDGTDTDNSKFMGSGTGDAFQDGVIAVSQSTLQAGGSASLTVNFVDVNNNLVADEITVGFSSDCVGFLLASIVENSVTTTTGVATATYSATGCAGDDTVIATASVDGVVLTATATLTVGAATVGSIEFISADPDNIGLLGTGGVGRQETATIRFQVMDSTGGPVAGATVDFSLNTTMGGINLTPTSATSDVAGFVQTVVSAGSVATSVRVTATVNPSSPVIATQSDQLTITTGIPDNDSVSVSLGCVNLEAWGFDGVTTTVTVRMSDRYNNPVPDGTAVTLTTEGGQVGGFCQTATTQAFGAGVCSVIWVSQAPRPADGRVTIIATAIGEESFIDLDSNGQFNGDDMAIGIGEPYRDDNENGVHDAGEIFSDFNTNGLRDDATHMDYAGFNGLLCDPAATEGCSANDTLFVSSQVVLVMLASTAFISDNFGGSVDLMGSVASITVTIGDFKGNGTMMQPMPGGYHG
jgi:protocatechuate 3,4-dioxygenase beta subunit